MSSMLNRDLAGHKGADLYCELVECYNEYSITKRTGQIYSRVAQKQCKDTSMGKCSATYNKECYAVATRVGEEDHY